MNKIGKYEIRSELGRGAMGIVYLGYDPVIERPVAIKTMNAEAFEEEEQKQRFLREARSAGAMQHPNIVTIYEMGMEGETPYIAMEFVEGSDLTDLIKAGGPSSLEEKLDIMAQLCDALDFAHRKGVIHRDIKPGNIRILPDGTVKIMDFGIAKKQDSDFTRTGLVVGTLSYMSPEQVQGKPLDSRSDQFSAGVVFYQMLTGKKPFSGDNLTNVIYQIISFNAEKLELPGTPTVLKKIVQKMMNPDQEKRFRSCGEVSALLKQELQYLKGEGDAPTVMLNVESETGPVLPPVPSAEPTPAAPLPSPVSRKKGEKTFILLIGILVLLGIVAGAGVLAYKRFIRPLTTRQVLRRNQNEVTPSAPQPPESTPATAESLPNKPGNESKSEITTGKTQQISNEKTVNQNDKSDAMNPRPKPKTALKQRGETLSENNSGQSLTKNNPSLTSDKENKPVNAQKARPAKRKKASRVPARSAETVFKKEGQGKRILELHKIFAPYESRLLIFKNRVDNMPFPLRRAMYSRELNMGRIALGNNDKIPAAVHFYRAVILQPANQDGYAWLVATLVDLKAYEDARTVIRKAGEHGVSISDLNRNMRFRIAYQKLQVH